MLYQQVATLERIVFLYYLTITGQQIYTGSLRVSVVGVLLNVTAEQSSWQVMPRNSEC